MRYLGSMVVLLSMLSLGASKESAPSLPPESRVILQPSAPIKILKYDASYQKGGTYSRDGVSHVLEYYNNSTNTVVAVQFGLVAFDVWNEFLDRTGGVSMDTVPPQGTGRGTWVATAYADFSFHTGVAYVSKVRFDTGEIWLADLNAIVTEMKKIQADFDAANLKKREPGK